MLDTLTDTWGEAPTDESQLLPALVPYLETLPALGRTLRAPLVFQVPFHSWALANRQHEQKSRYVDAKLAQGDPGAALWMYERPYRMTTLAEWIGTDVITHDQLRELLPDVWVDTEFPYQFGDLPLVLFRRAGFVTDDPETRLPAVQRMTVYRGQLREHPLGISWTRSKAKAQWFSGRFGDRGVVVKRFVAPEDVLGYFTSRGEEEVVIDPRRLTR